MSNKSRGREVANMDTVSYIEAMGGTVNIPDIYKNTGVNFNNYMVSKYFKLLREYALNRVKWYSDTISEAELKLIEWNIFHYSKCATIRPTITRGGIRFKGSKPMIFRCTYGDIDFRTGRPRHITLFSQDTNLVNIDNIYYADDFVIFTDEFMYPQNGVPFASIAWEYANKLFELDLAFNANSHKLRIPIVFNNGGMHTSEDGMTNIANKGVGVAEIMRSAFGRNEMFTEIPESMVGANGSFLYETQYVENNLSAFIDLQQRIYENYFMMLGLYTNKEKSGSYVVKEQQNEGDQTGNYKTKVYTAPRLSCAKNAVSRFGIKLTLEVVE